MRFALLGTHPDGLAITETLLTSGNHQLLTHCHKQPDFTPPDHWPNISTIQDVEEVLADPQIEAVIVATSVDERPLDLRRAVQSERHVLCVHPLEKTPDTAFEAGVIQSETNYVVMPLLPDSLHPALQKFRELYQERSICYLHLEISSTDQILTNVGSEFFIASLPGWDILRAIGGEIAEVMVTNLGEELTETQPVTVHGFFVNEVMFQMTFLPERKTNSFRMRALDTNEEIEWICPHGYRESAFVNWHNSEGELQEEYWQGWSPWSELLSVFEQTLAERSTSTLPWQSEIRCLELDDAARRSVKRGRSVQLEYPEASEEVNFKGTMTLVGCGLLWIIIVLAIASRWYPWVGWVVGPVLFVFLLTQFLRFVIPARNEKESSSNNVDE